MAKYTKFFALAKEKGLEALELYVSRKYALSFSLFHGEVDSYSLEDAQGLSARGIYNGKTDEIEMIGQAIIIKYVCGKPLDTIRGERVKYNQTTNVYQAFGGPQSAAQGGRVRSLATPSAKADAAAAACREKSKN